MLNFHLRCIDMCQINCRNVVKWNPESVLSATRCRVESKYVSSERILRKETSGRNGNFGFLIASFTPEHLQQILGAKMTISERR